MVAQKLPDFLAQFLHCADFIRPQFAEPTMAWHTKFSYDIGTYLHIHCKNIQYDQCIVNINHYKYAQLVVLEIYDFIGGMRQTHNP